MTEQEKRIEWLERQLAQVRAFIDRDKLRLENSPGDRAYKLSLSSWESHRDELVQDLRIAQESLRREVIQLRITGWRLDGSIPLRLLTIIASRFNSVLGFAAYHLRYGSDPKRGIPDEVYDELDVRLSGLAPGSTRLLFAGSTAPDVTGEAVLEAALLHIFGILNDSTSEEMQELISHIGIRATRELCDLLKELEKRNIGAELTWPYGYTSEIKWGGSLSSVRSALHKLSIISKIKPERITLCGTVSVLNESGSIILRSPEGDRIKVEYNRQQYEHVQKYTLGMSVSLPALKYTVRDEVLGKEKSTFKLITE